MSIDRELAAARSALEAGKPEAALKSLAAAWRTTPAPELLELACAVSPPASLQAAKGKETTEALQAARREKPDLRLKAHQPPAVYAAPADDTPRRVFADFSGELVERGVLEWTRGRKLLVAEKLK